MKIEFQSIVIPFHIFRPLSADLRKKASIILVQVMKRKLWHFSTDMRVGGLNPPNLQWIPPNSSSNLRDRIIFEFIVFYHEPPSKLKSTPDIVDLVMDLIQSKPANTDENQPITNLKPRISANTTVTSKNVKICSRWLHFCSKVCDVSGMI